ncbi:hypothetical protein DLJ53_09960 [Acuticoccus sediminis]|uniref:Zn-ribbon domain-containing OB-fold protein n=1 Tax=Acuticoccus sediminis TaxID=2184697 RepID=A0A8B2NVF2_9HYPH|nr:zinc ribbon domain-containing protein [Acuticoccus sediminis]RAI01723.1 hypothetical protein DLJ53_09960 [Acuticoccus sediminis]
MSADWPAAEERLRARDPLSRPFWAGLEEGRFLVPVCRACERPHFYPRPLCPHCGSREIAFEATSPDGVVISATTLSRAPEPQWEGEVPYTLAVVRLDAGISLMARAPNDTKPGDRVRIAGEPIAAPPFLRLVAIRED